jgi:hypothetical protein
MDDEQKYLERISSLRYQLTRLPGDSTRITHTLGGLDGLPDPAPIEGHQPHLLARGMSNTLIIGLVETGPDFTDEQTLERFRALGSFIDQKTGERAALNVAVPKELVEEAERGLKDAGLTAEEFNVLSLPL